MSSRTYELTVKFDWDFDTTYTDESSNVISVNVERSLTGLGKPLTSGGGKIDRATIELRNVSNRYNSRVTTGALYSSLQNGGFYYVPVTIDIAINGGSDIRIFTGISTIPVERNNTINSSNTITVQALSVDEKIRNTKRSLDISQAFVWLDELPNESTAITYLLSLLSLSGTIDPGLFNVFPFMAESSVLETIWNITKVSGGYFYTDRNGNYIYKNMAIFANKSSRGNVTRSNCGLISLGYDDINLSNSVVVKGSVPSKGNIGVLYTHSEPIRIPKDDSVTLTLYYNDLAYNVASYSWTSVTTFGGTDISSDLSYTFDNYIDKTVITLTNANTTNTMVITGFVVNGYAIVKNEFSVTKESADSFWSDRASIELETKISDDYLVSSNSADALASMILDRQETPIAGVSIVDFIWNDYIELLDKFTIQDTSLFSSDTDFFVSKIGYRISGESGLRLSVEGVLAETIYPYINDADGYFILATNEIGSSATNKARLFY